MARPDRTKVIPDRTKVILTSVNSVVSYLVLHILYVYFRVCIVKSLPFFVDTLYLEISYLTFYLSQVMCKQQSTMLVPKI